MEVFLVEDNPGDVRLTTDGLKLSPIPNNVSVAMDGMEALRFLRREGEHSSAPRPDLILLDLNLPKKSGLDVLAEIKADAELRDIPVVILTSSDAEQDLRRTYKSYANCCIRKPIDLDAYFDLMLAITEFWFRVVNLPPEDPYGRRN